MLWTIGYGILTILAVVFGASFAFGLVQDCPKNEIDEKPIRNIKKKIKEVEIIDKPVSKLKIFDPNDCSDQTGRV